MHSIGYLCTELSTETIFISKNSLCFLLTNEPTFHTNISSVSWQTPLHVKFKNMPFLYTLIYTNKNMSYIRCICLYIRHSRKTRNLYTILYTNFFICDIPRVNYRKKYGLKVPPA